MKAKFATRCCVIALLWPAVLAQAADAATAPTRPPAVVKDAAIAARIKARLADDKTGTLARVRVEADRNGSVVLRGRVSTLADEERAVSIARDTEGVKLVRSAIQIDIGR